MRIYKSPQKDYNFLLKNYLQRLEKNLLIKLLFVLITTGFILVPIDFINSSFRPVRYGANLISRFIGNVDKKNEALAKDLFSMGDNLFGLGYRYIKSFTQSPEKLQINLSFKNYKKISTLRNRAIKDGILVRSENDKVNGEITYRGKSYPIRLRLKGDWTDHLIGDKWSFRVETRKDTAFLGMREFSLQHPRTRNYLNEFIFQEFLKYEKLPYLRYRFVPVSVNGKYLGIYALEEHFGKELIENSKLREGPILKISDQDIRNEWKRNSILESDKFLNTNENNAEILTFNLEEIAKKDEIISQFKLGSEMLDNYLRKNIKTSELFDLSMTAKYFAIIDLLQALFANTWYDMRFYLDPLTTRLTPIGYDAQLPYIVKNRLLSIDQNVLKLFDDSIFVKEYVKQLDKVTKDGYLEDFFKKIDNNLKKETLVVNKSFPFVSFNKNEIFKNRTYIKNRLTRLKPIGIKNLSFSSNFNNLTLDIFNKNKFPLTINSLNVNGVKFIPSTNNFLVGEKNFKRVRNKKVNFIVDKNDLKKIKTSNLKDFINSSKENYQLYDFKIDYSISGLDSVKSFETKLLKSTKNTSYQNSLIKRDSTYLNFKNIDVDQINKVVTISNDLIIEKPFILPKDFKLIIKSGVNIDIKNDGLILLNGPLIMLGDKLNQINVNSFDGGKGISIINSSYDSIIDYSNFDGLDANSTFSSNITGAISFYNSRVEIKNSRFKNNKSEDALNLVRSPFIIENSYFSNISSDAVDIDFSDGIITNTNFEIVGNDSVDISGSSVQLENLKITVSGDKAVSVGESSNVLAKNILIDNAFIGIASKDLSSIFLKNLKTNNVNICIAAYEKKKEYGPGLIKLDESNNRCNSNYILESGSSILYMGYPLIPNTNNAYRELYLDE